MDGDIHVLAVDDSHLDRKVVERMLRNSSYKVTTVDSALRALEVLGIMDAAAAAAAPAMVLNAVKINLIITDYCMPEMTGYDLLKKVKESSALKEIPVVIMSSENVPSRIKMCMAEGAKEFIIKPLRVADVKRLRGFICQNDEEEENEEGQTQQQQQQQRLINPQLGNGSHHSKPRNSSVSTNASKRRACAVFEGTPLRSSKAAKRILRPSASTTPAAAPVVEDGGGGDVQLEVLDQVVVDLVSSTASMSGSSICATTRPTSTSKAEEMLVGEWISFPTMPNSRAAVEHTNNTGSVAVTRRDE